MDKRERVAAAFRGQETENLVLQGGKSGYIIGADCSISNELPEERIRWVVEAVRKI